MEQHWEHKIAEAYKAKDAKTSYENKDELWSKISGGMAHSKGVAAFWKVAAIFLALVMFSGAFAAVSILNNQNIKLAEIENQNLKLQGVVDSLMNSKPVKVIEIQVVEKERLIYKEVVVQAKKEQTFDSDVLKMEVEIKQLHEQLLISKQKNQLTIDSLMFARLEIENRKNIEQNISEKKKQNFKLKPEKVKDQMQQNLMEPTPKMKIQLFKIQDNNIKYDTNSTLLKK
ncbi:MAG: hypothetical protein HQ522_08790 [Bacteroidetes bacterium]|nr:hypothetical protein [Bacteroidota bacterium]